MNGIVILTGAGVSLESELAVTGKNASIWTEYDQDDIATPEGFARNPALVHEIHNRARKICRKAQPNEAHRAFARLEAGCPAGETLIVTMNVDDLHQRAGSKEVWHTHGELSRARCTDCGHRWNVTEAMKPETLCCSCGYATTRPDIVWFGETPYRSVGIRARLRQASLFAQIGSSGTVYPVADYVNIARATGARTLSLNLDSPANASGFDEIRFGKASEIVPKWVDEVLSED